LQKLGATEALPPEDADMMVDICSTGATVRADRRLRVVDCILHSTTRFICSREARAESCRLRLEEGRASFSILIPHVIVPRGFTYPPLEEN